MERYDNYRYKDMLSNFIKFTENNKLKVDSIIISVDGNRYAHTFTDDSRKNVRSISKTVSCLGIYKAIESNLFDLDSPVMSYFDDIEIQNKDNLDYLSELKIRHLLTLTMGHEKGLMLRKDYNSLPTDTDYISYILNYPIVREPGTFFVYNNAATYLLSAIVQKLTSMYFDKWVHETVLKHIGIEKPQWERTSQGICFGATGLYLNNDEMHSIGLLLLNRGKYNNSQIIKDSWVDAMHEPHIHNPGFNKYDATQSGKMDKIAYGYHIWVCGDGGDRYPNTHYYCDGADGQFLIVSPKQNMVITALSHQKKTGPLYDILGEYLL
jgi:CubicO group peptidase (beta-lactamase class C family)